MDKAIVGVCADPRQKSILEVTYPTWEEYGKRHRIPVHVIDRSYAGPHFYWTKHLLFKVPELSRYDSLLFLDNDVVVSSAAPSLFKNCVQDDKIGLAFESTQGKWSADDIAAYYRAYGVTSGPLNNPGLGILNTGVMLIPRGQAGFLESQFEQWKIKISSLRGKLNDPLATFAYEADQPHISYALQSAGKFADIGEIYNTLWWDWFRKKISSDRRLFLIKAKVASLLRPQLPKRLWRTIFSREIALFRQARTEAHFLHVAGSKSPIFLSETLSV